MRREPVPILEQGRFDGASPAGYPGPAIDPAHKTEPVIYQVVEEDGRITLRPHPPSRMMTVGPAVVIIVFGLIFAAAPSAIERELVLLPAIFGVAVAAAGPFVGRAMGRRQRAASEKGPVMEWDTAGHAVRLTRQGRELHRQDILAVEHITMHSQHAKAGESEAVQALVLAVHGPERRVTFCELAHDVGNGRMVAEDLCRRFDVGLHDVHLRVTVAT